MLTIARSVGTARTTLALTFTVVLLAQSSSPAQQKAAPAKPVLSVYKTATCGCCGKWVDHMKANGFDARVQDVDDLDAVKKKLGVPPAVGSCHTSRVDGYIVEGHIPAGTVHRLLKERPAGIAGLAVPGMPIGSPGMEVPGGRRQPYLILTFDKDGKTTIYERR